MRSAVFSGLATLALLAACSGSGRDTLATNAKPGAGTNGAGTNDDGSGSTDSPIITGPVGEAGVTESCVPDPSHFEVPGNGCDDDGDGKIDNPPAACDASLAVNGDAEKFAHAMGLCQRASATTWGLVSASYRRGYNDTTLPPDGQHGILGAFGTSLKAREGDAFGVLSSGYARVFDDLGSKKTAFKSGSKLQDGLIFGGAVPPGFPKSASGCPGIPMVQDVSVLHLEIKVPTNAKGLQFDFNFLSGEWPEWVCSTYNDSFIAYLKSAAFNGGKADNVSFDSKGAPVSINNAFFDRCTPNQPTGCLASNNLQPTGNAACPGGESELAGTGFEDRGTYCGNKPSVGGGGTGWLTSQAPVKPGETITLEFYVWDGTDGDYDSSVLLDNLRWVPEVVTAPVTTRPPK
ncbi:MAG: choice-of-anchor L domain-containing protein [Polyangiaceae bacterium]